MIAERKSKLFGEIAVDKGLVTPAQIEECLEIQRQLQARGIQKTLGAVLHDREYLSLVQVNEIMEEVEGTRRRQSIEGYEILSKLGKGGMGSVYLARQLSLGKLVAIKVLPPKLATNEDYLRRFRREAMATAKLNHPNIVGALDVGESNGYNYFVMEYVEGETIKDLLERSGIIEESKTIDIACQVADALVHAWAHQIVHRDIKPANIMITKQGQAKLCDLGLAIDRKEDSSITRSGVIMGTPYYLSPEQARSEDLDARSDIYSLGATLFHMLTGTVPFEGDTPAVILTRHLTEPAPDPRQRNPLLSKGICYIVTKCMKKERELRYQTPAELLADLKELRERSFLRGKEYRPDSVRAPAGTRGRLRRSALIAAVALPTLALALAAALDRQLLARMGERARALLEKKNEILASLPRVDDKTQSALEAAREAEQRAEQLLAEAEGYASSRAEDPEGARARFAAIAKEYGKTAAATKARARMAMIDNWVDREAKSAFFTVSLEARSLREQGRYGEAIAALDRFPARFGRTIWGAQVAKEREIAEREARARFSELSERAGELARAGRIDEARATLREGLGLGLEDVRQRAAAEIAALDASARRTTEDADQRLAEERRQLFARAFDEVAQAAREGRLEEAAARTAAVAQESAFASVRREIEMMASDLRRIAAAESKAAQRLDASRGKEVRIFIAGAERVGVVEEVRDGSLFLKLGIATVGYPLSGLDPAEYLSAEYAGGEPVSLRLRGLLHLLRGEAEEARTVLQAAHAAGEEVSAYLERAETAASGR